ncbi:MAG: chemotaxis protein CheW [Cytophagaceae bacterium]|jgi:purine-binding chemotaxis protein CheW|nr:chemotaxis protein CheW [Cytophagaceae bacterium]
MDTTLNSYLVFKIGEENFGINVSKVREIREYTPPKPIPQTYPFVAGVTEYQEEIIPLVDTGVKFGMAPVNVTPSTCVIVLELEDEQNLNSYKLGISIDSVSDVLEIKNSDMKNVTVEDYKPTYISSFYMYESRLIYILDADVIFNRKEVVALMNTVEDAPVEKSVEEKQSGKKKAKL